jgi:hypothetical protein
VVERRRKVEVAALVALLLGFDGVRRRTIMTDTEA